MAIDAVFVELIARPEREELGMLSAEEDDECDAPDAALHQNVAFGEAEGREFLAELCIVHHFSVADGHVYDVDRLNHLYSSSISIPILYLFISFHHSSLSNNL